MNILPNIVIDITGNEFLLPYFQKEFIDPNLDEKDWPMPCTGVKIVTDEQESHIDSEFETYCSDNQLPVITLRCPYIVGTGMLGLVKHIAADIYRGTYVNIAGNEAHISLIHATDVAKAAKEALGSQGTFTLTDLAEHTITELADALGERMSSKRIFTLKPHWARLWLGKTFFEQLTTDHVAEDTFALAFPDFKASNVTDYLKTHVYDQSSL